MIYQQTTQLGLYSILLCVTNDSINACYSDYTFRFFMSGMGLPTVFKELLNRIIPLSLRGTWFVSINTMLERTF